MGLSLIFGMMDVLNLAHGVLFLTGAYVAWWVAGEDATWLQFLGALVIAGAVGVLAGVGLSLTIERLARRSHLDQALLTLGLALIAGDGLSAAFGNDVHTVNPPPGLDGSVLVLGKPTRTAWADRPGRGAAAARTWWSTHLARRAGPRTVAIARWSRRSASTTAGQARRVRDRLGARGGGRRARRPGEQRGRARWHDDPRSSWW